MTDWTKLTVKMWSQIVQKVALFGIGLLCISIAKNIPKKANCEHSLADSEAQTSHPTQFSPNRPSGPTWWKLGRIAGLGLKIRQRMLTICCFGYFLATFFQSNPMPNKATFWTIWGLISMVSFVQSNIFVKDYNWNLCWTNVC